MRKLMLAAVLATVSLVLFPAPPVLGQILPLKFWVSTSGSDNNDCRTPATACRTFQRVAGGDVGVLNAGDYGPLETGNPISITADGVGEVGFLNIDGSCPPYLMGIDTAPGATVTLRGLVFDGCGGATSGIVFAKGEALHIENCVFRNFQTNDQFGFTPAGLKFNPEGSSKLFISDTIFLNNGLGTATGGIIVQPGAENTATHSGSADIVMERVQMLDNVVGLRLDTSLTNIGNGIHVVLRDSVVSGNAGDGISVFTQPGSTAAFVFVERSTVSGNRGTGIITNGPRATVLLSDTTITRNGTGVSAVNGGQMISYGNNRNNNNIGAEGAATGSLSANF